MHVDSVQYNLSPTFARDGAVVLVANPLGAGLLGVRADPGGRGRGQRPLLLLVALPPHAVDASRLAALSARRGALNVGIF